MQFNYFENFLLNYLIFIIYQNKLILFVNSRFLQIKQIQNVMAFASLLNNT